MESGSHFIKQTNMQQRNADLGIESTAQTKTMNREAGGKDSLTKLDLSTLESQTKQKSHRSRQQTLVSQQMRGDNLS